MRIALVVGLLITGLLIAYTQAQQPSGSVYDTATASKTVRVSPELITHFAPSVNGGQHTVVVVDPKRRTMAVYHVQQETGAAALKSVRNLSWDLQMIQFNSENPSPQDVRAGLEQ